jgi:hypothetical protein
MEAKRRPRVDFPLVAADKAMVDAPSWESFDLGRLSDELRATLPASEAEKMVCAFEQAIAVARVDAELLSCLFAAAACLLARIDACTPRAVFEAFFRRAVSDDVWRERYLPLFL